MKLSFWILVAFFLVSCNSDYTPKPRAFFKIDLPNKHNLEIDTDCPFVFEKPTYSILERKKQHCFYNLNFPNQNGILHITYLSLDNNLLEHTEESRRLAFNHDVMADAIIEQVYINEEDQVYGMLYDYDGVTATSTQFYLTDSINHFFRGALYFNTEISDSLLSLIHI